MFNDFGQQTLHISFEGVVTEFIYDNTAGAGGRLVEKRFFPDVPAYDAYVGDPVANPPAETIVLLHDAFGRIVRITHTRGGVASVWETAYDERGWIIREVSPQGAVNYEYDPATGLRLRLFTGTSGTYAGDQANPVEDFRYVHDELGRLVEVQIWRRNGVDVDADGDPSNGQQPETTGYRFDLPGNLARVDLPNGIIAQYLHDELNRIEELRHFASDPTPEDLSDNALLLEALYGLRPDGRRTSAAEAFRDENGTLLADTLTTWDYDELGRLRDEVFTDIGDLLAEVDDYSVHYTHDLTGNRRDKITTSGGTTTKITSTYDANDRLLTEELDAGNNGSVEQTTAFGYTGTQETSRTVTDQAAGFVTRTVEVAYDLQGRMSEFTTREFSAADVLSRSEKTSYEYDPEGIRVIALHEIDENGEVTRTRTEYLVDRHNDTGYTQTLVETVTDDTGAEVKKIVYTIGLDQIAQTTFTPGGPPEGETLVFAYDGHGSVRALFEVAGALAVVAGTPQVFFYDAYGTLLNMSPAQAATSLLYSGEFLDAATGQQYLRARWYNPLTGRFNRLDPFFGNLQDPQSLHKYLYAHGDPTNLVDPSGEFGLGQGIAAAKIGLTIGALAGGTIGTIYGAIKTRTLLGALTHGIFGALIGGTLGALNGYLLAAWAPAWAAWTNVSLQAAYFEVGMMLAIPQKIAGSISLATAIASRDPVDIVFGSVGFGGSFVITVLPTTRTFRYRFVGAKKVGVQTAGQDNTEIDQVRLMTITEYKDGTGLAHPLNAQTPQQWAERHIYNKTVERIGVIEDAINTFITDEGSGYVPSVQMLQRIRNLHFAVEHDEPGFRNAVNSQIEHLRQDHPDWRFSVEFGAAPEGQHP